MEYSGYFVKVTAQNENFIVEKVDSEGIVEKTLATIPDVISVVNLETSMSWWLEIYSLYCILL